MVLCEERGSSLVEILIAMSIAAVGAVLATPAMVGWVQDSRLSAHANDFLGHLALARTESIRRGKRVVICASGDGQSCSTSGSWGQGRIVFVDGNNNAQREGGEALLSTESASSAKWVLKGNTSVVRYVSYHPLGRSKLVSGAFQAGTITVCPLSGSSVTGSQIVISSAGRPRSQRVSLPSCTE